MTVAVRVEQTNGHFAAEVVGAPDMRATGASRETAIGALRKEISDRLQRGEWTQIEVRPVAITSLFGSFADDPTILEIGEEAHRLRDSELES
jgi:hypothetical protein